MPDLVWQARQAAQTVVHKQIGRPQIASRVLADRRRRRHGAAMSPPRTPQQQARFVRSTAADLDVSPELAERLLTLSEGARRLEAYDGRIDAGDVRVLREVLLDDELCRHAWWVAGIEGERLWRLLVEGSRPPRDIGPAVLLAVSLARRGAADEALAVIRAVIRPREFRRSAIEIGIDLAEDAGRPDLAWDLVVKLGRPDPVAEWGALWCVLVCSGRRGCPRSRLAGATHARWLRRRVHRWARRPWSGCVPSRSSGGAELEPRLRRYEADPVASAAAGYLESRASLLPAGERRLLRLWSGVQRRRWTVLESGPFELAVDDGGRRRVAGWDDGAPTAVAAGLAVDGWLLPTLVPTEHLLVASVPRPPWSR